MQFYVRLNRLTDMTLPRNQVARSSHRALVVAGWNNINKQSEDRKQFATFYLSFIDTLR
jgi:hypothetical protein